MPTTTPTRSTANTLRRALTWKLKLSALFSVAGLLSACQTAGPSPAGVDPVSRSMRTPNVAPGNPQPTAQPTPQLAFPSGASTQPGGTSTPSPASPASIVGTVDRPAGAALASNPPIDFRLFPPAIVTQPLPGLASGPGPGLTAASTPAPTNQAQAPDARATTIPAPLLDVPADPFDRLIAFMAGAFSSEQQSLDDRAFFDIRLHMTPIWQGRNPDAPRTAWLYVEQAMSTALDKPYRQRIYRVTQIDPATFRSEVFELPGDPLRFAGAHANPRAFDALQPQQLSARVGCELLLQAQPDGSFQGATNGRDCPSTLRGASYATSEARITPEGLVTWDRGYNDAGSQVWGAVKGGYIFKRVK